VRFEAPAAATTMYDCRTVPVTGTVRHGPISEVIGSFVAAIHPTA
jgi:hypothetical protein